MRSQARWGLLFGGLAALCACHGAAAQALPDEVEHQGMVQRGRQAIAHILEEGTYDIYLPFHTHHLRFAYDRQRIAGYQENPLGFGLGRSLYENGVWRGLYVMGFQDSHFKPSYMVGYGHQWLWQPAGAWHVGGGLTAFVMTRADIGHYTPFPGVLPTASLSYGAVAVEMAYVPGSRGAGNLLFFWARIELDKK